MTDPDLNTLALGTDLTTLGLNLSSTEVLYATFAYPCANDSPVRLDGSADYVLPFCYYMAPPALKTSHLTKFTLETLFYIFYNMPKDTLQIYAARELYQREWRYHKEIQLWFTRQTNNANNNSPTNNTQQQQEQDRDSNNNNSRGGTEASMNNINLNKQQSGALSVTVSGSGSSSSSVDSGLSYVFFDVTSWETRLFRDPHLLQPQKFLTEEELAII